MFRASSLTTLSILALFGCFVATNSSAQYFHGESYGHFGYGHSTYSHYVYANGYGHGFNQHPRHLHGLHHRQPAMHSSVIEFQASPTCTASTCTNEFGGDGFCEAAGCPLQYRPESLGHLNYNFQRGYPLNGFGDQGHSGHAHDGHSHEPHGDLQAPSDRGYIAPPSLPPSSFENHSPQPGLRREPFQRDGSNRMESPPPRALTPIPPTQPESTRPEIFDTPPPTTL